MLVREHSFVHQKIGGASLGESMPSLDHESLILLFRNQPALAAQLLSEALQLELPAYTEARLGRPIRRSRAAATPIVVRFDGGGPG